MNLMPMAFLGSFLAMISYYAWILCKIKGFRRILILGQYSLFVICLMLAVGGGNFIDTSFAQANKPAGDEEAVYKTIEIFPLVSQHVHGSTIVELPNGDLLAAWFQGSGERWADDVAIMGARLKAGEESWSKTFVMADVPGFPDINPILFIDSQDRLWLMWYTVIANQWETSLPKYRISRNYMMPDGPPEWSWQDVLHVKPGDPAERGIQPGDRFVKSVERQIKEYTEYISQSNSSSERVIRSLTDKWEADLLAKARGEDMMRRGRLVDSSGQSTEQQLGYPYFRRMGWQTKNKAVIVDKNRIIVPFYSDGFSFSLMAITDNGGLTWQFSEPLVAPGNIQPSIAKKADGTLVAYMRDNGPPPQRLHVSTSTDKGLTWSPVRDSELPNPGSGADVVTMKNGHWALAYNDTEDGRYSLAISISTDEGKSWKYTRHLELDTRGKNTATSSAYPSIIQGRGDILHVVYSYHHNDRKGAPNKTIKYARFNEAWVMQGDTSKSN
jgi:predicted neuraminidase